MILLYFRTVSVREGLTLHCTLTSDSQIPVDFVLRIQRKTKYEHGLGGRCIDLHSFVNESEEFQVWKQYI